MNTMGNIKEKFLCNPEFYGFIVALLALILSQLPPVHTWFKKSVVNLITEDKLYVYNKFGILDYILYIDMNVEGNKTVDVRHMYAVLLKEDDNSSMSINRANSYYFEDRPTSPFTIIKLKPNSIFRGNFIFSEKENIQLKKKINDLNVRYRKEITPKDFPVGFYSHNRVYENYNPKKSEVAKDIEKEAIKVFNDNFKLTFGNYKLLILLYSDKKELIVLKGTKFTLFEYEIKTFKESIEEEYQLGTGFNLFNSNTYLSVPLTALSEKETDQAYDYVKNHMFLEAAL